MACSCASKREYSHNTVNKEGAASSCSMLLHTQCRRRAGCGHSGSRSKNCAGRQAGRQAGRLRGVQLPPWAIAACAGRRPSREPEVGRAAGHAPEPPAHTCSSHPVPHTPRGTCRHAHEQHGNEMHYQRAACGRAGTQAAVAVLLRCLPVAALHVLALGASPVAERYSAPPHGASHSHQLLDGGWRQYAGI